MTSSTAIVMVRHASHGLLGRILAGRMPGVSLDEAGHRQARRLATHFAGTRVSALACSPLDRARQTAEPIAEGLGRAVEIAGSLNEIDFGMWTGASFADLDADERWPDWCRDRENGRPPAGEAMAAVQARMADQMEAWRERYPNGRVVAVSHADVIKAALCHVLGLSLDRYGAFDVDPASLSTVVVWKGGGKVESLNVRLDA